MQSKRGGPAASLPSRRLDQLYDRHFDHLMRYATRILQTEPTLAEDVVQEAFVRLMTGPPRDLARAGAWLRIVVQRLCYDRLRQQGREILVQTPSEPERVQAASTEDIVLGRLDRERVRRALGQLHPRESRALWLRHAGYSYREIGQALNVDPNQIGVVLLRSMQKLKRVYDEDEEERKADANALPRGRHVAEIPRP